MRIFDNMRKGWNLWYAILAVILLLPVVGCGGIPGGVCVDDSQTCRKYDNGPILAGTVVSQDGGRPLPGALIILPGGFEVACDDLGNFEITFPEDTWQVTMRVAADGYKETLAAGLVPPQGLYGVTVPLADSDSGGPPLVVTLGEPFDPILNQPF